MKLQNKTAILLYVALVAMFIVVGVYASFFISMKNKAEATARILSEISDLSAQESNLVSSVSTLKTDSINIDKISSYFFNESGVVEFVGKIEKLGSQSGTVITIESLEPGVTENSKHFISFRVKASGSFENVWRLLVLLENFPGKFDWRSVRLVRDSVGGSDMPLWSVDIFLSVLNVTK